jgi:hypothetical protein
MGISIIIVSHIKIKNVLHTPLSATMEEVEDTTYLFPHQNAALSRFESLPPCCVSAVRKKAVRPMNLAMLELVWKKK